jgi:hypothetical protein
VQHPAVATTGVVVFVVVVIVLMVVVVLVVVVILLNNYRILFTFYSQRECKIFTAVNSFHCMD